MNNYERESKGKLSRISDQNYVKYSWPLPDKWIQKRIQIKRFILAMVRINTATLRIGFLKQNFSKHYGTFVNIAARLQVPSARRRSLLLFLSTTTNIIQCTGTDRKKYSACNLWDGFDYPAFPLWTWLRYLVLWRFRNSLSSQGMLTAERVIFYSHKEYNSFITITPRWCPRWWSKKIK